MKPHTEAFLRRTIMWPTLVDAVGAMERCHGTRGRRPKSMFLVGPSGAGKSTIARYYVDRHPAVEEAERTRRPVLYVALTAGVSVKGILAALLSALGAPAAGKGSKEDMAHRLVDLIHRLGIELIIIDEVHHVLPEHTAAKTQQAADLFKWLIDTAGTPFVFVGLSESVRLMRAQRRGDIERDQLHRRCRKTVTVDPPHVDSSKWKALLNAYQAAIEKSGAEIISLDDDDEMRRRLYLATMGLHGRISNLLEEALELVEHGEQITLEHLARAHEESMALHDIPENPFSMDKRRVNEWLDSVRQAA